MELIFRKIREDDLDQILNWRTKPEVSSYMYTDIEPSMENQNIWFDNISRDSNRLDWIINFDGEDVGLLSLVKIDQLNRRCEWAYYLGSPNVRGKGIGKNVELNVLNYVFNTLNLNKLCCEVFVSNDFVIKIHEKYGSKIEGTRREQIYKNGEFHDIVEMSILKSDWIENIKDKLDYLPGKFE